jgi:hypothetical protein
VKNRPTLSKAALALLREPMPKCFDSRKQWEAWRDKAIINAANDLTNGLYCADCTPEYQQKMIVAGRCAHPLVLFKKDEDGFLVGVRPRRKGAGRPVCVQTEEAKPAPRRALPKRSWLTPLKRIK